MALSHSFYLWCLLLSSNIYWNVPSGFFNPYCYLNYLSFIHQDLYYELISSGILILIWSHIRSTRNYGLVLKLESNLHSWSIFCHRVRLLAFGHLVLSLKVGARWELATWCLIRSRLKPSKRKKGYSMSRRFWSGGICERPTWQRVLNNTILHQIYKEL